MTLTLEEKMKKASNYYLGLFILILFFLISGCAGPQTSVLKLNYEPVAKTRNSTSPPSNVKLSYFQDVRDGKNTPEIIGHKEAAFGVSMGDVKVEKPVSEIIYNAFKSELIQNGYSIVNAGEDITITGKILQFRVGTNVTALYWDVYGEMNIEIDVIKQNGKTTKVGPYYAKNVERTYAFPSEAIMERVLLASLKEVAGKFLADKDFAN
jgi:uncharacterized lipoprotein YajG